MKHTTLGRQDFRLIRQEGLIYVDKTDALCAIARRGGVRFISRPRRFGRSLAIGTLDALFRGDRELFTGLWAERNWDWTQKSPVLRFSFVMADYRSSGLRESIERRITRLAEECGVTLEKEGNASRFRELIGKLYDREGPVVVLVDEYDKPLIDYVDDLPTAQRNGATLREFYSGLQGLEEKLRLVFLTGVSKFYFNHIFSGLNALDLSAQPEYGTAFGYTQEELERYFAEHIQAAAGEFGGREALLAKMEEWFGGYCWGGSSRVYAPHSVMTFLRQRRFSNFWFESGTPTFLVKLFAKLRPQEVELKPISIKELDSHDPEDISLEALLFQTGYVTCVRQRESGLCELACPNRETDRSLLFLLENNR